MPFKRISLLLSAGALCIALIGYTQVLGFKGLPQEALQAQAKSFGWDLDDLQLVEGKYGSRFLAWTASARYVGTSQDRDVDLTLEVFKASPFHDWQVRRFQVN